MFLGIPFNNSFVISLNSLLRCWKMKRKMPIGLIRIFEGLVGLLLTILINKYIDISDIYIIILMFFSIAFEIYGLILLIKDRNI